VLAAGGSVLDSRAERSRRAEGRRAAPKIAARRQSPLPRIHHFVAQSHTPRNRCVRFVFGVAVFGESVIDMRTKRMRRLELIKVSTD
jgi:hypothetical protein